MSKFRCEICDREFQSKDSLNMHNQAKHSESYKESKLSKKQKKRIKNYGIVLLIVLAIGGLFYWKFVPPKNAPIIEITPSRYDFGIVSQAKGIVSTTMTITNKGNKDLILKNMDSSCGCTSAAVVHNGVEGPGFSMSSHGTNPKDWRQTILPGETTELKVYYDPNVHKDLRGSVTRSIFIFSNDPRNPSKEVRISAYQTD